MSSSHRRLAAPLVVLLATTLCGVTSPPATARAHVVVVVHDIAVPEAQGFATLLRCDTFTPPTGSLGVQVFKGFVASGDDAEGLGTHAALPLVDGPGAFGQLLYTATPSTAAFTLRARSDEGAGTGVTGGEIALYQAPGDTMTYWAGSKAASLPADQSWTLLTSSGGYTWRQLSLSTGEILATAPGTADLDDFAAAHGGDATDANSGAWVGWVFGCGEDVRFAYDGLRVGAGSDSITVDFERVLTGLLTPTAPTSVTAGKPAAIEVSLDPEKEQFSGGVTLELQARPAGAAEFTTVGTGEVTDSAPAQAVHKPEVTTTYRWFLPEGGTYEGSYSPTVTVKVRPALTIAAPKTAKLKAKFSVTGTVKPVKKGAAVTLQRLKNRKWVKLDVEVVNGQGRYAFRTSSSSKGKLKLRVVIGADASNLAGTSPTKTVRIT